MYFAFLLIQTRFVIENNLNFNDEAEDEDSVFANLPPATQAGTVPSDDVLGRVAREVLEADGDCYEREVVLRARDGDGHVLRASGATTREPG